MPRQVTSTGGSGDVWMWTTEEYRAASPGRRLPYRIFNHLFPDVHRPGDQVVIVERFILDAKLPERRLRISVFLANLAIVCFVILMCMWMGPSRYITVQLMVLTLGGSRRFNFLCVASFPGTNWRQHADWDDEEASLASSSRVALPPFLQRVTGSIG
jgi:omega-6 fatty acid desaturase (delta-12 desaturase)